MCLYGRVSKLCNINLFSLYIQYETQFLHTWSALCDYGFPLNRCTQPWIESAELFLFPVADPMMAAACIFAEHAQSV